MGKVNIKQLNYAPDTGYVIGSGVGGVPIWKVESSSVAWADITGNQADINLSGFTNDSGFITGNQTITLSGDVTGSGTTEITTSIANNAVTNATIRQSAGLSVLGRSAATSGNIADITGSTNGHALRIASGVLGFGTLPSSSITATNGQLVYASGGVLAQSANLTYSGTTLQNIGGGFIIGNLTGSTAAGNGILMQRGTLNAGLYTNGTTATFGAVTAHPVSFVVSNTSVLTLGTDLSVMIGTSAPNAGAILNVVSSTKGMYIPRLTSAARASVASPGIGMILADTDLAKLQFNDGTAWRNVALEGVGYARSINTQTVAYQPVLTDQSKIVTISNASPVDLTVPLNSTIAFPVGSQIDIIQLGAGQVTVVGAGGVTVNSANGLKLRAQYSSATLIKLATDTWVLVGDTDI